MNAKLQGFLSFLDLLAEGQRRQAELITGRSFEPAVRAAAQSARVVKFPLTGHQKARWNAARRDRTVSIRH
ncbi:MAG: hypothetical protein L0271_09305 [Gemmatimonadetes bacterium]|nr:hypothetical protein [Gemmatimonadota bacterium]